MVRLSNGKGVVVGTFSSHFLLLCLNEIRVMRFWDPL